MVPGSLEVNIIWRLVGNIVGVMCQLVKWKHNSFLYKTSCFENGVLYKVWNERTRIFKFRFQHLGMKAGKGASLKCVPGHKNMEDYSVIRGHFIKIGVMRNQNLHIPRFIIQAFDINPHEGRKRIPWKLESFLARFGFVSKPSSQPASKPANCQQAHKPATQPGSQQASQQASHQAS